MIYALHSPTAPLTIRRRLAKKIFEETRTKSWGSLQDEPWLVYAQNYEEFFISGGFCVYCNTAVGAYFDWGVRRFRHDYHNGGIRQEYCREIGRLLGMTPVYPMGSKRDEESSGAS